METFTARGRILHATLCEVECGLFQISYRAGDGDRSIRNLPPYQVGTSSADAMQRAEHSASFYGYDVIIWDTAFPGPGPSPNPSLGVADHSKAQDRKNQTVPLSSL
jgi:hypothetical protein